MHDSSLVGCTLLLIKLFLPLASSWHKGAVTVEKSISFHSQVYDTDNKNMDKLIESFKSLPTYARDNFLTWYGVRKNILLRKVNMA